MREYKITMECLDENNANGVAHQTKHIKYVDEDKFNEIYKLLASY